MADGSTEPAASLGAFMVRSCLLIFFIELQGVRSSTSGGFSHSHWPPRPGFRGEKRRNQSQGRPLPGAAFPAPAPQSPSQSPGGTEEPPAEGGTPSLCRAIAPSRRLCAPGCRCDRRGLAPGTPRPPPNAPGLALARDKGARVGGELGILHENCLQP